MSQLSLYQVQSTVEFVQDIEYTASDGLTATYTGEIVAGKRHGRGALSFANGVLHNGEWKDDKMNGRGTLINADGSAWECEWKDGKMNGLGTYIPANGSSYKGIWIDGNFEKKV
jgi:hypothetical protein